MSKRYSGKSFKDSSVMKKPKLTFKEKRRLKKEKKKLKLRRGWTKKTQDSIFDHEKTFRDRGSGFVVVQY